MIAKRASAQPSGPALAVEALDTGGRWELPGDSEPIVLSGPLAEITAYLTGRTHKLTTAGGEPTPTLGPWL